MTCKVVPDMTYNVSSGTLSLYTTVTTREGAVVIILVVSLCLSVR